MTVLENVVDLWKVLKIPDISTQGNLAMRFIGADPHKKSITFCVVEVMAGKNRDGRAVTASLPRMEASRTVPGVPRSLSAGGGSDDWV